MKNTPLLLTALFILMFLSCSKDNKTPATQEVWVKGYKALYKAAKYEVVSSKFMFFSTENGNEFKLDNHTFHGTISEYQEIKDDIWSLLKEGKLKTIKGEIVTADASIYASAKGDSYAAETFKTGKYLMISIYQDSKDGYLWLYSNKYACQYIDIKHDYNPESFSVVFPCDLHHYGKIDWVSWNQSPYPYDFDFK